MLGFDANSTLSRRVVKPVFEAALTYEAASGVIEVEARTGEDRIDLTRFMARDLLGIGFVCYYAQRTMEVVDRHVAAIRAAIMRACPPLVRGLIQLIASFAHAAEPRVGD